MITLQIYTTRLDFGMARESGAESFQTGTIDSWEESEFVKLINIGFQQHENRQRMA